MPIFSQAPSTRIHHASYSEKAKPNGANGDWLLFGTSSQNNEIEIAKCSYNSNIQLLLCTYRTVAESNHEVLSEYTCYR